jgi:hypothetical protein
MKATQISVFLENRPGRLRKLLQVLASAEVNLRGLSVADTADFGIARLIVADVQPAVEAIRSAGLTVSTSQVLRVEVPDVPGALAYSVIGPLADAGINVQYLYSFNQRPADKAIVVLKVDDVEKALQVLG